LIFFVAFASSAAN